MQIPERYVRQLPVVGEDLQRRLGSTTVVIVGCGGLGSAICELLARLGVNRLYLINRDVVKLHNLNRGSFFTVSDLGKPKAQVCAERTRLINPEVKVEALVDEVRDDNVGELIGKPDVVFGCTDNIRSRLIVNKYCVSRGLPWIYAAAEELYGYVMLIVPCRTACLSCLYSVTPAERREIPVIGPAVTMVASIATMKLLELVRGEIKSELTYVDCRELTIEKLPVQRRENCPACGSICHA